MNNKLPNVKFWDFVNLNQVKIKLIPGQRLDYKTRDGKYTLAYSWLYDKVDNLVISEVLTFKDKKLIDTDIQYFIPPEVEWKEYVPNYDNKFLELLDI